MIRVTDKYVIQTDGMCYTVQEDKHKLDKNNNPVYDNLGYYSTLLGCLESIRVRCVKDALQDDEYTLAQAITIIQNVVDDFKSKFTECVGNVNL